MTSDLKTVIRDNVRALLDLAEGESGVSAVMRLGFQNGTAQRILSGETSLGLDVIDKLAQRLRVQPWQLCVPGLRKGAIPALAGGQQTAPEVPTLMEPPASIRRMAENHGARLSILIGMAQQLDDLAWARLLTTATSLLPAPEPSVSDHVALP